MKKRELQRSNSDLLLLLDTPATWVVRARSGAVGNAACLRAALEVAARKAHAHDPLESITSVSRFDDQRIHIHRRQIHRLLERSLQSSFGSDFSPLLSSSDAPTPMKRWPFSPFRWIFSWKEPGKSVAQSGLTR